MCFFCEKIYSDEKELNDEYAKSWIKDSSVLMNGGIISSNNGYDLCTIETGGYHNHTLDDIEYCPYCGRKL